MMAQAQVAQSTTLRDLLALTKPRITALVLLTTAGGLWLAPGEVGFLSGAVAIVATALVVAAANTLNCYLERESDGLMTRTKGRPLPAGRMAPRAAMILGLALAAISIPALTFWVNPVAGALGAFAFVSYVWIYTPLKRKSPLALAVGAVPGAIPPLLGWSAATGHMELPGLALFAILFFWQLPHFLAISLFRKEEYRRAGILVLPVAKGEAATRWRIPLYSAALVASSLTLQPLGVAGSLYTWSAAILGAAFFAVSCAGLSPKAGDAWAKRLFFGSLLYLTALFIILALDAR